MRPSFGPMERAEGHKERPISEVTHHTHHVTTTKQLTTSTAGDAEPKGQYLMPAHPAEARTLVQAENALAPHRLQGRARAGAGAGGADAGAVRSVGSVLRDASLSDSEKKEEIRSILRSRSRTPAEELESRGAVPSRHHGDRRPRDARRPSKLEPRPAPGPNQEARRAEEDAAGADEAGGGRRRVRRGGRPAGAVAAAGEAPAPAPPPRAPPEGRDREAKEKVGGSKNGAAAGPVRAKRGHGGVSSAEPGAPVPTARAGERMPPSSAGAGRRRDNYRVSSHRNRPRNPASTDNAGVSRENLESPEWNTPRVGRRGEGGDASRPALASRGGGGGGGGGGSGSLPPRAPPKGRDREAKEKVRGSKNDADRPVRAKRGHRGVSSAEPGAPVPTARAGERMPPSSAGAGRRRDNYRVADDDDDEEARDRPTTLTDDADSPEESDEDSPLKKGVGCVGGCMRDTHTRVAILSLGTLGFLIYNLVIFFQLGFVYLWTLIPFIIFYLLFICETRRSNTFQYLRNINTTESLIECMDLLYRTKPEVVWTIQCYHNETLQRIVYHTDCCGKRKPKIKNYTVRVNTHYAQDRLVYGGWSDVSAPLRREDVEEFRMTKVSLKKEWIGDNGCMLQKQNFINFHDRDHHYNFSETLHIDGFVPRALVFVDTSKRPCLANMMWFLLSHALVLFALPYRMWLSSATGKVRSTIQKQMWT